MKETLGNYVARVRDEGRWSREDVAERARRKGFKISQSYIQSIETGSTKNPSLEKFQALAAGLAVPVEKLLEVAGMGVGTVTYQRDDAPIPVFLAPERPAFETGRYPATPEERALMDEAEARGLSFDTFGVPGFWDRPEDDPDREDAFHHLRRMIQIDKRIRGA